MRNRTRGEYTHAICQVEVSGDTRHWDDFSSSPSLLIAVIQAPSYDGRGLVNLVAEIEHRLTGSSSWSRLDSGASQAIPDASTYVIVLFDGLGVAQLEHPKAASLKGAMVDSLDAPFPTTTSVSLSTIATGLPPSKHGQVSHLTWMEDLGQVVNCLKWVNLAGQSVPHDYGSVLPSPNLWERLRSAGIEPITVQPGDFAASPLTRVLYRGARFEGIWDVEELSTAAAQLAGEPGRLVFAYFPLVDVAGHVYGLGSDEFSDAMNLAVRVWEGISSALPPDTALVGTSDHGLVEFRDEDKLIVRDPRFDDLRLAGDARGVHLWADDATIMDFAAATSGQPTDPLALIGPAPTDEALARLGRRVVMAPADKVILPRGFDRRLRCYHGGLTPDEVRIPLLVG